MSCLASGSRCGSRSRVGALGRPSASGARMSPTYTPCLSSEPRLFACTARMRMRQAVRLPEHATGMLKKVCLAARAQAPACRVLLDRMRGEAGGAEDQVLQAWERQVQLEGRALEATVDAYRKAVLKMLTRGEGPNVSAAQRMMVTWFGPLRNAIAAEQRAVRRLALVAAAGDGAVCMPFSGACSFAEPR